MFQVLSADNSNKIAQTFYIILAFKRQISFSSVKRREISIHDTTQWLTRLRSSQLRH